MATNRDLNKAKTARKDEFYTQLSDIIYLRMIKREI